MATFDQQQSSTERPRFCPECGQPGGDANFCPGCGHNMGFTAESTLADPVVQTLEGKSDHRNRFAVILTWAALGAVAIAVAAVILLSGSGGSAKITNATVVYKQQLAKVFGPVLSANQSLSSSSTALDGSKASIRATKTAATQAAGALAAAHGAIGVISAPSSQSMLAGQVQQALTAENGYLQAVSSTLAAPTGPSTGQLQTLATGAQSALDALDAVSPGAGNTLSGTGNLVNWAQGAGGQAKSHQKAAAQAPSTTPQTPTPSAPTAAAPNNGGATANSEDCGGGLIAGPHTSCAFAENVQSAWDSTPGEANTVVASSPVTGLTYTESCAPSGSDIVCTGVGADNSVSWAQ